MKTIAIVNLKGGVGKTTTVLNMAALLAAEHGKRVLIIDADSQYNLSMHLRADRTGATLCSLFEGEAYYENLVQQTYLRNVDIIPASLDLMEYDLSMLKGGAVNQACIRDLCAALSEDEAYDFVLIDCPPSFSAACAAAIVAADEVIIPTTVGAYEQEGIKNLLCQIDGMRRINPGLRVAGVLVTMYQRGNLCLQGSSYLRQHLPVKVFETEIWRSAKVGESAYAQQPVLDWSPGSWAGKTYRVFVNEYLGLGAKLYADEETEI